MYCNDLSLFFYLYIKLHKRGYGVLSELRGRIYRISTSKSNNQPVSGFDALIVPVCNSITLFYRGPETLSPLTHQLQRPYDEQSAQDSMLLLLSR